MLHATLRVYAELNDFLPRAHRQRPMRRSFSPRTSVKDLIEGAGVPHTEVDLVLVNGASVDFAHLVQDGGPDQRLPGLRGARYCGRDAS